MLSLDKKLIVAGSLKLTGLRLVGTLRYLGCLDESFRTGSSDKAGAAGAGLV